MSWKVYQQLPDNYTDNPLSGFKNYRDCYSRVNQGIRRHAPVPSKQNAQRLTGYRRHEWNTDAARG